MTSIRYTFCGNACDVHMVYTISRKRIENWRPFLQHVRGLGFAVSCGARQARPSIVCKRFMVCVAFLQTVREIGILQMHA